MDILENCRKSVLIILYSVVVASCHDYLGVKRDPTKMHEEKCAEFGKNPYFELDMVVGIPWRTYYTWNMDLGPRCVDMKFKMAGPMVIRRVYYDMKDYLEEQPAWGSAILLMTMGRSRHEMLLFDDQGPAGRFYAVPNVVRDGNISPQRSAVPLLRFYLKLVQRGRYLVMMDCQIGVISLSARLGDEPTREQIVSVVNTLGLGYGRFACFPVKDKGSDLLN